MADYPSPPSSSSLARAKNKNGGSGGETLAQNLQSAWFLHGRAIALCVVLLFAFLVRLLTSLSSHSGEGIPPKYGDYEAQRHWMEITLNTPMKEWYRNTTYNDLAYWGLDYPPLTAYQSYVHSLFLHKFDPDSVALGSSKGYETPFSKLLMRWTVLSSDALVLFPAAVCFVIYYYINRKDEEMAWLLAMILLNPSLILIDHGHFQYNCISLGLTLGAIAAILSKNDLVACALFSLALNHKQMTAYFAPAFFGHLLGKCLKHRSPIFEVLKLGITVTATFIVIWWPYLHSMEAVLEVLSRLAPFERGIYEDYVANFWCSTSFFVKWKRLFGIRELRWLSLLATLAAASPSMIQQIKAPSSRGFLYALVNSSFAFYLFSFQVHEKSILLPLLPASLLALEETTFFNWFSYYALLSMYPLLCRDGLIVPHVALLSLFFLVSYARCGQHGKGPMISSRLKAPMAISFLFSVILYGAYLSVRPPQKYPFLFDALIMILCFSQYLALAAYSNVKQWMLSDVLMYESKEKKRL
ncbi:probable dolichyl pyrophosphate Man9GlcNAc2 alpha-1,3-glucosyltransferase [Nymphaea colorata]|nr:probable dolichyl pyrophosphate Man9GlcNAc2 alpha-1,3-glucosyltransferase [Nymphaea colorata]XP_031477802.1 probable dolichyl pyrophosphate Man9GlcNAc2 alpha-1,3-glucosyltransferase [Nymphaea colorata]